MIRRPGCDATAEREDRLYSNSTKGQILCQLRIVNGQTRQKLAQPFG